MEIFSWLPLEEAHLNDYSMEVEMHASLSISAMVEMNKLHLALLVPHCAKTVQASVYVHIDKIAIIFSKQYLIKIMER